MNGYTIHPIKKSKQILVFTKILCWLFCWCVSFNVYFRLLKNQLWLTGGQMRFEQYKVLHIVFAAGARVHPVGGVARAPVHGRGGRVHEAHRTQTASIRPGARVHRHMIAQTLGGEEAARTRIASVHAILLVRANVLVEHKLAREPAATNVTRELIVFYVGRHVFAQQATFEEGRGAVFTFERSANIKRELIESGPYFDILYTEQFT